MANKHIKNTQSGKCKLNHNEIRGLSTRMAKIQKPTVGKEVEQSEVLYIVVGNIKWYNHFEKRCTHTPTL